ncbi:helicase HerA domain-containing protein [Alsobacter sp. R-9]
MSTPAREVVLGSGPGGAPALLDLEELLATRLLVQGNSGSGKSYLLRRLLEQSAGSVQQAVIDPEGDFTTLAERYGHVVVDGLRPAAELEAIAERVRRHRVSVVLDLEGLDAEAQMKAAAAFLNGLFEVERDHWYPMLVVVDEAQLFAPGVAGEVSDEARRVSLGAMTNLMCRGRKRGLAGVVATQRLAKLAKNVAAEASNFLMGRTFLDIDMARAADLLGLEKRQAEMFRDLERGRFVALGPALSRRPVPVAIGPVETRERSTSPKLMPMPEAPAPDAQDLILAPVVEEAPRRRPPPPPRPMDDIIAEVARPAPPLPDAPPMPPPEEVEAIVAQTLAEMAEEPDTAFRPAGLLYQDFLVRCRIRRLHSPPLDLAGFRRRMTLARAAEGLGEAGEGWDAAVAASAGLDEDLQAAYLAIARAALEGAPCPTDDAIAEAFGSHSPGRGRRAVAQLEQYGLVVCRADIRGHRIAVLPDLERETAPQDARGRAAAPLHPRRQRPGAALHALRRPSVGERADD